MAIHACLSLAPIFIGALLLSPLFAFGGLSPVCTGCRTNRHVATTVSTISSKMSSNDDNNNNDEETYNQRDNLGRAIQGFQSVALKETIEPGDTVVCKRDVPSLNIYENEGYELRSIYAQYFNQETQTIVKEPLASLDAPVPKGCDRYITLYSPVHHKEPVVVAPDEVGLASVRSELGSAAWLAVPGFFWVFVASSFYNIYHERTGGSFFDAFWGR